MTEEIKSKIDDQADKYGFVVPYDGSNKFYNDDKVKGFQDGATYGYQLAEDEINRLKGLLHETWNKQYPHPEAVQDLWQQFKTDNNL